MSVQESSRKRSRNTVPSSLASSKVAKTLVNADRECRISDINKHCASSLPIYNVKVIPTFVASECSFINHLFTNHLQYAGATSNRDEDGAQTADCQFQAEVSNSALCKYYNQCSLSHT